MSAQDSVEETPLSSLSEATVNLTEELRKRISSEIRNRKDTPYEVWALYWLLNYLRPNISSNEKQVYFKAVEGNLSVLRPITRRKA